MCEPETAKKPSELRADVPPELDAIVIKAIEKEAGNRFQSMDEVLEAMKAAGSTAGLSGAFSDPRSFAFRPPSSQSIPVQNARTAAMAVEMVDIKPGQGSEEGA